MAEFSWKSQVRKPAGSDTETNTRILRPKATDPSVSNLWASAVSEGPSAECVAEAGGLCI